MDLLGSQVSARLSETEEGEHDSTMNKSAAVSDKVRVTKGIVLAMVMS